MKGSVYRIVLADDHVIVRQGIRRMIEEVRGLKVVGEASDGLELLKIVKEVEPHMIVLDISMPNLRGIEATRELKRTDPHVKVLMLTMHRDKELVYHAIAAGADGYLLKEDSDTELVSAIDMIRQGRSYLSPFFSRGLPENWPESVRQDQKSPLEHLTPREREVLKLVAEGKSSREIGKLLFISSRTVENHRAHVMNKLGVTKTVDLVKYAIRMRYTLPNT
jgi:DNA-binding NarL/FixJ family response regulator